MSEDELNGFVEKVLQYLVLKELQDNGVLIRLRFAFSGECLYIPNANGGQCPTA